MRKCLAVLLAVLVLVVPNVVGCGEKEEPTPGVVNAGFGATPTSGGAPLKVQFIDESTGTITERQWDFNGDGTVDSTQRNPSHTYDTVGTYTVSLTVTGAGSSDTETKADFIQVKAVNADFSAQPVSGRPPLKVQFTDLSTAGVTEWQWDFTNDGTVDSTEQNPSHTYGSIGTYSVSLTATGPEGSGTETKVDYIQVADAVPTGTFTVAILPWGPAYELSPWARGTAGKAWLIMAMADGLIYSKADNSELIPGLAESWQIAPDKRSITLQIRQGVQFHNGWGELTAEDVKFTLETGFDPGVSQYPTLMELGYMVDRIETSGDYELTIYLTNALADDVPQLLCPDKHLAIPITSKAHYLDVGWVEANQHPVYTGPYKLVEYSTDRIEIEAVDDHWRVVPEYKTIIFLGVAEEMTRVGMVRTGEADIAQVSAVQGSNLEASGYDVVRCASAQNLVMGLGGLILPSHPNYDPDVPWLDKRVREAMNLAINREEIAEVIFHGYAEPLNTWRYTPYSEGLEQYPYNPERAMELLAEAGYEEGFDIDMWDITTAQMPPEHSQVNLAIASYWQAIGLNPSITPYQILGVYGKVAQRNTAGSVFLYSFANYKEPWGSSIMRAVYSKITVWPVYETTECDTIIDSQQAAETVEARDAAIAQLVQHLYDEYAFIPVVAADMLWAKGPNVGNWEPPLLAHLANPLNLEYITHPEPLGTFRLWEP
ncbi:ABC transporter substrate-binding protein [Chloroflexota bacterium]